MTGQEAVRVAEEFDKRVGLTGLILTKLDGDARGGAALSIRASPACRSSSSAWARRRDALEPFYPDRMASRILGMGDVLTLIEKAQETIDPRRDARRWKRRVRRATFTLEDFLEQFQRVQQDGLAAASCWR